MGVIDQLVMVWVVTSARGVLIKLPNVVNGKAVKTETGRVIHKGLVMAHPCLLINECGVSMTAEVNDRTLFFPHDSDIELQMPVDIRPARCALAGVASQIQVKFSRIAELVEQLGAEWLEKRSGPPEDAEQVPPDRIAGLAEGLRSVWLERHGLKAGET